MAAPGVGYTANGATRWIDLGPIRLQASELARPLLLIFMASYAVRQHKALGSSFAGFARPVVLIGLASVLLLAEPDYGATVVLTATCIGILFLAGARLRDVLLAAAGAGIALGLLARLSPYRWERILSFLHPWQDRFDTGYQLVNSFIAIGSGTWFGAGLGTGVQKLHYLPEAHTDFVFAVLAEELGFVGASLLIGLFALLVYRAFDIGRRAQKAGLYFHGLLAMGIGLTLGLEVAISIGVNTGLLPTKGLTLPLISYGRASAVMTLFTLGLLFRVGHEVVVAEDPGIAGHER
jgi:cell division protein FtsW